MYSFDYRKPQSVREAVRLLAGATDGAKPLAGGTDLLLQMKDGRAKPGLVVDVKGLPELQRLDVVSGRGLHLGAAVPITQVLAHPQVAELYPILHRACSMLGSLQIRNRASVGGNLCHAAPSASTAPPLLCLGAQAVIAGPGGRRRVPLEEFFLGPGQTVLGKGDLLVEVFVPQPAAQTRGSYQQLTVRKEMDIPIVNASCMLWLGARARCRRARVALGAVAPTPLRALRTEAALEGQTLNKEVIEQAAQVAAAESKPIDDVRASAEYRREMVKVLTRRALQATIEEALSR